MLSTHVPGEEHHVLEDLADSAAEAPYIIGPDVHPVDQNAALPDIVEAVQQLPRRSICGPWPPWLIVLADEPTGSLDRASADAVVDALLAAAAADGAAVVMVTHDALVAIRADRRAHLDDGRLWADAPTPS